MGKKNIRTTTYHQTTVAAVPEKELRKHLDDLGITSVEAYRQWCRASGFRTTTQKDWQERRQEKQARTRQREDEEARHALTCHYKKLGFTTLEAYHAWCVPHDFSRTIRKTSEQCETEIATLRREKAQTTLKSGKRYLQKPEEQIQAIFRGEYVPDYERQPVQHAIFRVWARAHSNQWTLRRDALLRLLLHVQKFGDMLHVEPVIAHIGQTSENSYIEALNALANQCKEWARPLEDWRPESHNARKQFASLARHLLAQYPVPSFMDSVWFKGTGDEAVRQQKWFLHIGTGQNIRYADLPLRLTEKAAHYFQFAPADSSVFGALRYGQLQAIGASVHLIRAVNATPLGEKFDNEEFWATVLHFFVNNPMLDTAQVGPIVDYIQFHKFTPQMLPQPDGTVTQKIREPGLSMKGRTPNALLRRVEEWHRLLAREKIRVVREWGPSPIRPFTLEDKLDFTGESVLWTFHELRSAKELMEEGKAMHHCVGTYADSCAAGSLSVWSLRMQCGNSMARRVLTIAVNHTRRSIVEARGKCNRLPQWEKKANRLTETPRIVSLWMKAEGLTNASCFEPE